MWHTDGTPARLFEERRAVEDAVERFQKLKDFYLAALHLASECDTPAERMCFVQEMRAIIDETKSVALEYRNLITRSHEKSASNKRP